MISQILETVSVFILNVIETGGYFGVLFLMILESANVPVPSEVIMVYAGFLAGTGKFGFWPVVFLGAFGNLVGSLISYGIGFYFKEGAVAFVNKWLLVGADDIKKGEEWVKKYGLSVVFFSRVTPIVRTFISVPAGIYCLPLIRFSVYTFFGSFLWSLFLTYIGFVLGENWVLVGNYFRSLDVVIALLVAAVAVYWLLRHWRFWRCQKSTI